MFTFTIHGPRGSEPVSGEPYVRYGGRTTCYSIEAPEGIIILDAGSGIAPLGRRLHALKKIPPIDIFFTHFHLDHIVGMPSFQPLYRKDAEIAIWSDAGKALDREAALYSLVGGSIWPVDIVRAGANVRFENLPDGKAELERFGITLSWCSLSHPRGSLSYKLSFDGKVIVLATDREPGSKESDERFVRFAHGADILLHDAQHLPEERDHKKGWGHSTWQEAVEAARSAEVGELILTHHDPIRTDKEIDEILEKAKHAFPRTRAAHEEMVLAGVACKAV